MAEPILIGAAGAMTGPFATMGAEIKTAIQFAVDDINAAGGLLGRTIELHVADDMGNPSQAVAAANHLASEGSSSAMG